MPITATPIDLRDLVVPDDLSAILRKGGRDQTPTFDAVLSRHRKLVSGLRRQVWPVVSTVEPGPRPEAAPEQEVPAPHPGVEPEPSDAPAPESAGPESEPEG